MEVEPSLPSSLFDELVAEEPTYSPRHRFASMRQHPRPSFDFFADPKHSPSFPEHHLELELTLFRPEAARPQRTNRPVFAPQPYIVAQEGRGRAVSSQPEREPERRNIAESSRINRLYEMLERGAPKPVRSAFEAQAMMDWKVERFLNLSTN